MWVVDNGRWSSQSCHDGSVMSNRTSYNLVAEKLREGILSGRFAAGRRLPSEHALCARYGVSRITIRHALQVLQEEAMVRKRRGSGNYVRLRPKRNIPIRVTDFVSSMARHAPQLDRSLLFMRRERVNRRLAEETDFVEGEEVLHASRLDALDRTPVAVDEVFLPARLAHGVTAENLASLNFLKYWSQRCPLSKGHQEVIIEAVKASPALARQLRLKSGAPLLKEIDLLYAAGGLLAAYIVSYYHPGHIHMTLKLNWV